jgi:hypothetical protein
MKADKIYISGKIMGDPNFKQKFLSAENDLIRAGWKDIINPTKLGEEETWEKYMIRDIEIIFGCTAIYMLSDWKQSRGARIEHAVAMEMNLTLIYQQ